LSLTLLSVTAAQARAFTVALAAGRPGLELSTELWRDYLGQELECFTCGVAIETPPAPFTQLQPDKRRDLMLATPLCPACAGLPAMVRAHRGLRLMRKMSGVAR
jgi:hypothetical protein